MSTYLITGGGGFIGSNLVEYLVDKGERVRIIDDFSTGKRENLARLKGRFELIEGSICDGDLIKKACEGVDYVLHHAALPSVPRSVEEPVACHEVAATGTLMVLEAARKAKVKRVIYAASSSAYGDTPTLPKKEDTLTLAKKEGMKPDPLSPYAVAKLTGEYYAKIYYSIYGLETVSLRYFNVFGPRQDPESQYAAVIPIFITKLLAGQRPTIFGDGEHSRDFTYIENVIKANLAACTAKDAPGKVFNIACGEEITINRLFEEIQKILLTNLEPEHDSERPADVRHSLADITAARKVLKYDPKIDLKEGLRRTVKWYKESL